MVQCADALCEVNLSKPGGEQQDGIGYGQAETDCRQELGP